MTCTHMICLRKVIAVLAIILCVSCQRLNLRVNCNLCGAVSRLATLTATFLFFSFFLFGDPKQAKRCPAAGRQAGLQPESFIVPRTQQEDVAFSFILSLDFLPLAPQNTNTQTEQRQPDKHAHTLLTPAKSGLSFSLCVRRDNAFGISARPCPNSVLALAESEGWKIPEPRSGSLLL